MINNPHAHRMVELVAGTHARAANIEHVWDKRAIDWPLTEASTVIEVGGYTGRWALQIAERYSPCLFVFEPQPWAWATACAVLGERADVRCYGLGAGDSNLPMGAWETDGCSFVKAGLNIPGTTGEIREIGKAFQELGIGSIDLMMVNIEGYEYTLIPHMLDRGVLPQRLMIQFHTFADELGVKQAQIFERLAALGYAVAWTYGPMLTAWEQGKQAAPALRRKPGRKPKEQRHA